MNAYPAATRMLKLGAVICLSLAALSASAQWAPVNPEPPDRPALEIQARVAQHFIAAHGRRSIIQGYAAGGLEIWAYPFQILSDYKIAFRAPGSTTPIDGRDISARVDYRPDSITRVYIGPNFIVHETLFVPLNQPGAILSYSIEGNKSIEIDIHATPVMNLMWPAGVGGQYVEWNSPLSAYILSEPGSGYTATVGSPDIVAHDVPSNSTTHGASKAAIGFTIHPDSTGIARVFLTLNAPHSADAGSLFHSLIHDRESLEAEAASHYREVEDNSIRIETPDANVNHAVAWSEIALAQAWICNPDLGCGYVAGYGPSRAARRPQYEWFFAGDGLVSTDAAVSTGDLAHAREELAFILRYQDSKTGMIWHELSQSAAFIDWAGKYPYMYVHVDITFQFLAELAHYVTATGDVAFVRDHWTAIEVAYRYCHSVIDPASALPRIPPDKEGGDEQDRMSDDLGLSASWVAASAAFSQLATLTGHTSLAAEAAKDNHLARVAIPARYWDADQSFWINGHTLAGQKMEEHVSGPSEALTLHLFNPQQTSHMLDELASSSFQTDWGTRSIGAGSAGYDAESYGKGSVWPLGTAGMAETFWTEHRPITALAIWQSMLALASLDSPGHFPEVMAGNFYHPQIESVPEQSWSSAGFLGATIHGLLGLQVDSLGKHLVFAPRIPAQWNDVSVKRIDLAGASVSLELHRERNGLKVTVDNGGEPFKFEFSPDVPLGATIQRVLFNRQVISAKSEDYAQQTRVTVITEVANGQSEIELAWQGGVSIIQDVSTPQMGAASAGVHVVDVHLDGKTLTIAADVPAGCASHLRLKSEWTIADVSGATMQQGIGGITDLAFPAAQDATASYRRAIAKIEFKP